MYKEKMNFVIGLMAGILTASLFLFYFAPRYTTAKAGDTLVRNDKWTGQSWRLVDNQWKAIVGQDHDWDKIDGSLRSALRIPFAEVDTGSALRLLREKFPVLKDPPMKTCLKGSSWFIPNRSCVIFTSTTSSIWKKQNHP